MRKRALVGLVLLSVAACRGARTSEPIASTEAGVVAKEAAPSSADAGADLSLEEICERTPSIHAALIPGKKPFIDLDPHCGEDDHFCNRVAKTPDPTRTCFVADDNIARAERESRRERGPVASTSAEWNGTSAAKYLDRIDAHFHLTKGEREKLRANRFVVLDRLAFTDYASAFHEIFQEQLPLFVGVDPILHAVFRGTEVGLERIEQARLVPALTALLKKLRGGLPGAALDAETRGDLDVYLGVAAALLEPDVYGTEPKPRSAIRSATSEAMIAELVEKGTQRGDLSEVDLFGRTRMIDFSQLEPRGHYGSGRGNDRMSAYFRAMMWLSRVELNLVSRSSRSSSPLRDPSETPREVKDALALVELIERTGAFSDVRTIDAVYTTFAGKREDVSPDKLLELARQNGIRSNDAAAADKLKRAIGPGFKRTARTHFTVENAPELPAIFTLLGPRIVPDVAPFTRVVHDEIPERKSIAAADAGYILGHDRARSFIGDLDTYPELSAKLAAAREELARGAAASNDVYGVWLRAILALGPKPAGVVPSFMKTDAYDDRRLESALVGFGQLRNTFTLLAGQGYDAYGCEIPDAYVEPLPAVYDALLAEVRAMRAQGKGWSGLERVLALLAAIAHDEAGGRVLTEPQRRWLGMVTEHIPNGGFTSTGEPPKWTGWYFDMFEDRQHGATKRASFIADYFTLTNAGEVAYLGAEGPRLAVFIVDTNGEPRAMVGPVAKGFETRAPIAGRLDDAKVFDDGVKKSAPWRASYAVAPPPEPPLGLEGKVVRCGDVSRLPGYYRAPSSAPEPPPKPAEWRFAVRSTRARAGATTITLLDHHGDPLTTKLTVDVDRDWKVAVFDLPPELANATFGVEAIHVRIEDVGAGAGPFDYTTSASVFRGEDDNAGETMPARPRGPAWFEIGALPKPKAPKSDVP